MYIKHGERVIHINLRWVFAFFVAFLTLKVFGSITWSWLWVFSPFWLPIVFILFMFLGLVGYSMIKAFLLTIQGK